MSTIRIEWLSDSHDCETCGFSGAEGASVFRDDKELVDLRPHAYCFDGASYDKEEVYVRILEALGHEIPEVDEDAYEPERFAAAIRANGHELVEEDRRRF